MQVLREGSVALFAALFVWWMGSRITLDAQLRTEQVSAMANLQMLVLLFVSVPFAVLALVAWRRGSKPLLGAATAVVAGLSSGLVAGLMTIALHGTRCPVNSLGGDAGRLVIWAAQPGTAPVEYPPIPVLAIRWLAALTNTPEPYVWKNLSLLLLAVSGPVLYAGWRLLYGPALSLALGPVIGLVFIDPYKPYSSLALGLSLLVLAVAAAQLRNGHQGWKSPVTLGVVLALVMMTYPGWLMWMAPGFVLFSFLLPWRRDWRSIVRYLAIIGATGLAVMLWWFIPAWDGFRTLRDTFIYPDVWLRPTYFADWQEDTPAFGVRLPQYGEFGGIDSYSLALLALLSLGLIRRGRTSLGILAIAIFAGAWLRKMQIASAFRESGLVQLFPRANFVLLLVALTIAVLGVAALVSAGSRRFTTHAFGLPMIPVLLIVGGTLFVPTLAEAAADGYMASDDGKGVLTKRALLVPCWPIPADAQPWVPE